ncbi:exonuclease domain-containing protein [Rathayibacter soli]|uniref:exonuclease domain-containing protein n=1 Tax=Rathayibacter soli TaxID=3144168 RepID=UPI0027E3D2F1|nr:exonuclease domain-containing protein [Glaciibacter superstes]
MSTWHSELGVFDLETTGVDVDVARIVTANVGLIDDSGAVIEGIDWLVDPGVAIPRQASAVHGVSTERAQAEGRDPAEAVEEIIAALRSILNRGIPVVAYNAPYDFTVLEREAVRYGLEPLSAPAPIVDPLVIDKALDKYRKGKRTLEVTAQFYGVELTDAHDAGADAVAAGRVAQAIARAHSAELDLGADELHQRQVHWSQEQAADFQAYMRRVKDPSFTTSGAWPVR